MMNHADVRSIVLIITIFLLKIGVSRPKVELKCDRYLEKNIAFKKIPKKKSFAYHVGFWLD